MELVRANMEDMAKLLVYGTKDRAQWKGNKTKVNMAATDNEGKTVLHHCVQSREVSCGVNLLGGSCLQGKTGDGHAAHSIVGLNLRS